MCMCIYIYAYPPSPPAKTLGLISSNRLTLTYIFLHFSPVPRILPHDGFSSLHLPIRYGPSLHPILFSPQLTSQLVRDSPPQKPQKMTATSIEIAQARSQLMPASSSGSTPKPKVASSKAKKGDNNNNNKEKEEKEDSLLGGKKDSAWSRAAERVKARFDGRK